MSKEFKKITKASETRYVLETVTAGATGAGAIATAEKDLGEVQRRNPEPPKPRNFVAKNAKMGGAGAHKDKKKAQKQGDVKHKKPYAENIEILKNRLGQLKESMAQLADESRSPETHQAIQQGRIERKKSQSKIKAIARDRQENPNKAKDAFAGMFGGDKAGVDKLSIRKGVAEGFDDDEDDYRETGVTPAGHKYTWVAKKDSDDVYILYPLGYLKLYYDYNLRGFNPDMSTASNSMINDFLKNHDEVISKDEDSIEEFIDFIMQVTGPNGNRKGERGMSEGYDQVGFLKQIVADIYPRGGDKEAYFQIAKKQVPSDYANSPEFKRDFSKAYDDFFGIEDDEEDDFDYTDYSMRKGEKGLEENSGMRLVMKDDNGPKAFKIYRDVEWNEFVVKFFVNGQHQVDADYHTDDKNDAVDTAQRFISDEMEEGYHVMPGIDKDRYQERPGLEGPFTAKNGKVVYYDPKEGQYYDPDSDFYISHDEWEDMNRMASEGFDPEYDDEAGMADNNLETLERAVQGIDELINDGDNLPEWCQEKIAVAKSMLVTVWDYMKSEETVSEDALDEKAPPGMEKEVLRLKKQYPKQPEKAYATAWSIYNKKHGKNEEKDQYFESLETMLERQLEPEMGLNVWKQNFLNANPYRYPQFKNKTAEKKR